MLSELVTEHLYNMHSELLRFYFLELIQSKGFDPYSATYDELESDLKKVANEIKHAMNVDMDDLLEEYVDKYLEVKESLSSINNHNTESVNE